MQLLTKLVKIFNFLIKNGEFIFSKIKYIKFIRIYFQLKKFNYKHLIV